MMLLILTDIHDVHADCVIIKLRTQKVPYVRMNLDVASLKKTSIVYDGLNWYIASAVSSFYSEEITAVWMRKAYVELMIDEASNMDVDFKIWKNEWNKTLIGLYTSLEGAHWLNFYRNAFRAENKYLQMSLARKIGFHVPETIISNCRQKLIAFTREHKNIVLKLMHQDFYKMPDGTHKSLYVNKLSVDDIIKFGNKSENPIVLQKYIEKLFEVRYTVVGKKHLVCRIDSQQSKKANIDWRRYDLPNTPHYQISPPKDISNKVNKLMKSLDLNYGALDFVIDTSGEWYFLEVNSMGQFLWIEDLTGLSISDAVVSWFTNVYKKQTKP